MMCYRDMTFCESDCANSGCGRFVSKDVRARATAWTQSIAPTLDFPLLADVDHALCDAVGVWGPQTFRGHHFEGIARTTFIVRDGVVTEVFADVSVMGHAERLLAAL